MKPNKIQNRIQRKLFVGIVYPLLLVAALCTMIPLLWLISSSFKTADEIFSVPIRWLPKLPPRVNSSPHILSDVYPKVKKPNHLDSKIWNSIQPELERVIWNKALEHLDGIPTQSDSGLLQQLQTEIVKGVWQQHITTLPNEFWNRTNDLLISDIENSIIPETIETILNNIYRQTALESIEIEDIEFNRYKIDNYNWHANTNGLQIAQQSQDTSLTTNLFYDFEDVNEVVLSTNIQSPVEIEKIRRVILPVRGDASYHHLKLTITANATSFIPTQPYILDTALRNNSTWRLHGIPGELEASQISMQQIVSRMDLIKSQSIPDTENTLSLQLTVHRPAYISIVWKKLTSNYSKLWQAVPFSRYFVNSVFIATASTLLALFFCSLGGFAFAKYQFHGKTILFGIVLASMMVPFQVLLVPLFGLMYDIGWLNSYNAIIFPFSVGAFGVFLMRQFIITIPSELLDAARIDGCSEFGIYYRIVLPIIKPALGALTIYTFLSSWNGYLWPLIVLRDETKYTLPIGLANLIGIYRQDYGMLMAGTLLSLLPIVILFLAMQREFVQGITLGSVKE